MGEHLHRGFEGDRPFLLALRPYRPGDEGGFTPRADFAQALAAEGGALPQGGKWTVFRRPGWHLVGVAGLEEIAPGRLAAWACLAPLRPREWLFVIQAARRTFNWARGRKNARTIVAIPAPTPEAVRLLKRIGFVDVGEPYMVWEG